MQTENLVTRTFRFTAPTGGEHTEEFDLPVDYTYLIGFTFSAGSDTDHDIISNGIVGVEGFRINEEIILMKNTPLRITQAQEVCMECKFYPYALDNSTLAKIKINVSVNLPALGGVPNADVILVLLMTNKKPNFNIDLTKKEPLC